MRVLLIALVVAVVAAFSIRTASVQAAVDGGDERAVEASFAGVDIDGDEDDVLEVQLFVLGLVIGTVFVLGTGAYFLRRKLGLTAYTPPADSGHH